MKKIQENDFSDDHDWLEYRGCRFRLQHNERETGWDAWFIGPDGRPLGSPLLHLLKSPEYISARKPRQAVKKAKKRIDVFMDGLERKRIKIP